jgi:DNA-binding NtrC family response regulator
MIIEMHRSKGTILVVEDDVNVRDVAVEMFESNGYRVITASDAESGIAQYNSHPDIVLVFTDLILPGGVTGIEMSKKSLKLNPDAVIILSTGYSEKGKAIRNSTFGMANIAYVAKPYDVEKIPKLVEQLLSSAAARKP